MPSLFDNDPDFDVSQHIEPVTFDFKASVEKFIDGLGEVGESMTKLTQSIDVAKIGDFTDAIVKTASVPEHYLPEQPAQGLWQTTPFTGIDLGKPPTKSYAEWLADAHYANKIAFSVPKSFGVISDITS